MPVVGETLGEPFLGVTETPIEELAELETDRQGNEVTLPLTLAAPLALSSLEALLTTLLEPIEEDVASVDAVTLSGGLIEAPLLPDSSGDAEKAALTDPVAHSVRAAFVGVGAILAVMKLLREPVAHADGTGEGESDCDARALRDEDAHSDTVADAETQALTDRVARPGVAL